MITAAARIAYGERAATTVFIGYRECGKRLRCRRRYAGKESGLCTGAKNLKTAKG